MCIVCVCINSCLLGDYVYGRILYPRFCLLKIYANVLFIKLFVDRMSITHVTKWHFIRIIYYYYYHQKQSV